jgi:hypothetical protein
MISFSNTVQIARSPDVVFAYLADLQHIPEWNWAIASTRKVTPGPVAVGTRYQQTRVVPRPAVEMLELTALEPTVRIEVVGDLAGFRAHLVYELAPGGTGTSLTNIVELHRDGLLTPVTALIGRPLKAAVAKNLEALRQLLQQQLVPSLSRN